MRKLFLCVLLLFCFAAVFAIDVTIDESSSGLQADNTFFLIADDESGENVILFGFDPVANDVLPRIAVFRKEVPFVPSSAVVSPGSSDQSISVVMMKEPSIKYDGIVLIKNGIITIPIYDEAISLMKHVFEDGYLLLQFYSISDEKKTITDSLFFQFNKASDTLKNQFDLFVKYIL